MTDKLTPLLPCYFDMELFACQLDGKRFKERMTWADVAKASGCVEIHCKPRLLAKEPRY
jgi:hypothetical protein